MSLLNIFSSPAPPPPPATFLDSVIGADVIEAIQADRALLSLTILAALIVASLLSSFFRGKRPIAVPKAWRAPGALMRTFVEKLGEQEDIKFDSHSGTLGFKKPFPVDLSVLAACQGSSEPHGTPSVGSKLRDGARFVRYARAAYGDAAQMNEAEYCDFVCKMITLAPGDLLRLETESHDDAEGKSACVRHFVALDVAARTIVLAVRGANTLTDAVRDAAGHAREFCGGKAHAEMSLMAQALWREVGPSINAALDDYEDDFELIITGRARRPAARAPPAAPLSSPCLVRARAVALGARKATPS